MQAAVNADDLAGSFAEAFRQQQENRLGLVRRCDGLLGQSPVGIELRVRAEHHAPAFRAEVAGNV